jgi:hypothetical protein
MTPPRLPKPATAAPLHHLGHGCYYAPVPEGTRLHAAHGVEITCMTTCSGRDRVPPASGGDAAAPDA